MAITDTVKKMKLEDKFKNLVRKATKGPMAKLRDGKNFGKTRLCLYGEMINGTGWMIN